MYPSVGSKRERRNDARWDDVWMTDTELETFVREVMHEVNSTAYYACCASRYQLCQLRVSLNSCRDRRHEASTVGVTATMACAVGAIKLRQSGIVPARSTSTSSFLLSSSLAVAVHSFQTTPL